MSVEVIKAFVRLREMVATHKEMAKRLASLENKVGKHDEDIRVAFEAIRELMEPQPIKKKSQIGF